MISYCLICGQKTKLKIGHLKFAHAFTIPILTKVGINEDVYFIDYLFEFLEVHGNIRWKYADSKERIEKFRRRALQLIEQNKKAVPYEVEPATQPEPPSPLVINFDYFTEENIKFGKGLITIIGSQTKRLFTLHCGKSIEGLNHIKKDFLQLYFTKPFLKLFYDDNGTILKEKSPDILALLEHIDTAIEFYAFKRSPGKKGKRFPRKLIEKLSNEQLLNIFPKQHIDKGPYVRHLYSLHDQGYKLIPIMESIGSSHEESFIFRIKNPQDRLFAVWENLNPGRATYVFKLAEHKDYLAEILGYIEEHESSKRLYLRVKSIRDNWPERELGFKGFIDHDSFDQFKYDFRKLIGG